VEAPNPKHLPSPKRAYATEGLLPAGGLREGRPAYRRQACLPVGREFVIWDFWCYALCHYLRERHHFKIPLRGRVLRRSGVPSHPRLATATPKLIIHI
jgi:hypothetical protein